MSTETFPFTTDDAASVIFRCPSLSLQLLLLLPTNTVPFGFLYLFALGDMDPDACAPQSMKKENSSQNSVKKLEENFVAGDGEANDVVKLQPQWLVAADGGAPLGPITPDSNRESGDFIFDFTSPLTLVSSPPKGVSFDSHWNVDPTDNSSHTPKAAVFDSFAPGPDKLMLAPHCNKYLKESQSNVARRLNFNASIKCSGDGNKGNDAKPISDEAILLETVYGTLLEAIVSKKAEGLFAEISPPDPGSSGFMTPTSAPRLNGITETCPGAPMKPTRKSRSIDQWLCRKLEF
ncbi:hypothetical protein F0562_017793 [Nyssa sinensis]|uniref:Uncharacterized protein n=1 Tax=Nyssa sinensis TaxID=561372 RepID=A0A5J4ZJY0_9ASTE|nr:hypothetical protein F0562_017793 [Nyssa sinensis]